VKRSAGPQPVLNKPIVLNAEGKIDVKEPEKGFLQKYASVLYYYVLSFRTNNLQVLVDDCAVLGRPVGRRRRRWEISIRSLKARLIRLARQKHGSPLCSLLCVEQ
jgi:hypothetical protein